MSCHLPHRFTKGTSESLRTGWMNGRTEVYVLTRGKEPCGCARCRPKRPHATPSPTSKHIKASMISKNIWSKRQFGLNTSKQKKPGKIHDIEVISYNINMGRFLPVFFRDNSSHKNTQGLVFTNALCWHLFTWHTEMPERDFEHLLVLRDYFLSGTIPGLSSDSFLVS